MRTVQSHTAEAKKALAELLDRLALTEDERVELAKSLAKFTASCVREDRQRRMPHDTLAKLADVFFNGRPA